MKISGILIILILSLGLFGCSRPYYTETRLVMGTFAEISCPDKDAINAAFEEIKKIEKIANIFTPSSEISQLNREGNLKASDDLMAMVKDSLKYYNLTNGDLPPKKWTL